MSDWLLDLFGATGRDPFRGARPSPTRGELPVGRRAPVMNDSEWQRRRPMRAPDPRLALLGEAVVSRWDESAGPSPTTPVAQPAPASVERVRAALAAPVAPPPAPARVALPAGSVVLGETSRTRPEAKDTTGREIAVPLSAIGGLRKGPGSQWIGSSSAPVEKEHVGPSGIVPLPGRGLEELERAYGFTPGTLAALAMAQERKMRMAAPAAPAPAAGDRAKAEAARAMAQERKMAGRAAPAAGDRAKVEAALRRLMREEESRSRAR